MHVYVFLFVCLFALLSSFSFVYRPLNEPIAWFSCLVYFLNCPQIYIFVNNVNSEVGELTHFLLPLFLIKKLHVVSPILLKSLKPLSMVSEIKN